MSTLLLYVAKSSYHEHNVTHPAAFSFLLTIVPFSDILLLELKKEKEQPLPQFILSLSSEQAPFPGSSPTFTDAYTSNNTMIRKNSLFCKLIHIKSSSKVLFDSYMVSFRLELETCPFCGSKGNCRIHAYYGRKIVDFIQGRPLRTDICILRLICSCGHTHAILPNLWKTHRELWLGALGSMEISDAAFLWMLVLKNHLSDFSSAFLRRFSFSFLQSHKNPTRYCRTLSSP